MSADGRNRGSWSRAVILIGVLLCHAVVGVACLVRGRNGFEAVLLPGCRWGVLIMVSGGLLVLTDVGLQLRKKDAFERTCWALAAAFALASFGAGVWLLASSDGRDYDRLAAAFSSTLGADVDPESGVGFAGIPWLALAYAACLAGFCAVNAQSLRAASSSPDEGHFRLRSSLRGLIVALGILAFGGILHWATGTQWQLG